MPRSLPLFLVVVLALLSSVGVAAEELPAEEIETVSLEAELERRVNERLRDDARLDVQTHDGATVDRNCFYEPACASRVADGASARWLVFLEVSDVGEQKVVSIDAYDVRRGALTGRETFAAPRDEISFPLSRAVDEILERQFRGRLLEDERLAAVVLPVRRLRTGQDAAARDRQIPWLLFGAGVVAATGAAVFLGAAGLFALGVERDIAAANAYYQLDAQIAVGQRDLYLLSSAMTAMGSAGLFLLAAMTATHWFVERPE